MQSRGKGTHDMAHSLTQEDETAEAAGSDIAFALAEELSPERNELLETEALPDCSKEAAGAQAHKYNHCSVCNSELGFTHLTHFEYNTVVEEAFCYVCQNKAKKQSHQLQ